MEWIVELFVFDADDTHANKLAQFSSYQNTKTPVSIRSYNTGYQTHTSSQIIEPNNF